MFEGFSFLPPPHLQQQNADLSATCPNDNDLNNHRQCDSSRVSPLSSRCPSPMLPPLNSREFPRINRRPRAHFQHHQPSHPVPAPTSIPASYCDSQNRRLSMVSLTQRLHAQSLDNDVSSDSDDGRGYPITPPRSSYLPGDDNIALPPSLHIDGCGDELPHRPWLDSSFPSSPNSLYNPSYSLPGTPRDHVDNYNGACSVSHSKPPNNHPNLIEIDEPGNSNGNYDEDSHEPLDIRHQREKFSILQCASSSVTETLRLAMLLDAEVDQDHGPLAMDDTCLDDEQHPSSLPASRSPSQRCAKNLLNSSRKRRNNSPPSSRPAASLPLPTSSAVNKSKIDKSQRYPATIGNNTTLTAGGGALKHSRSRQNLRRKSLVLAAVTAVLERDAMEGS